MLKTFRRNIAVLAACLTGLVLVSVCIASFVIIRNQYEQNRENEFRAVASTVFTQWQLEDTLSPEWLQAHMEMNSCRIALWENNIMLGYQITDKDQAAKIKEQIPASSGSEVDVFSYEGKRCAWYVFPFAHGSRQFLIWQESNSAENAYLSKLAAMFFSIALAGLCVVGIVCYFVSGLAMEPIRVSLQQQEYFVAAASHELKGPLTVLQTGFDMIRLDPDAADAHMELMRSETTRMCTLLNNLLLLAGGNRVRKNITFGLLDPDTLLINFVDSISSNTKRHNMNLCLDLPDNQVKKIRADSEMLVQVLQILTDNAFTYASDSPSLEFRLEQTDRWCKISVVDHGPGISHKEKGRIFDRFYRGSVNRSDPNHYGLGLSVAQEILHIHNGKLTVLDTPGGGATFLILLPI